MHNIQLGSEVIASDGHGIGKVDQIVINPESQTLIEVIVQHSLFHTGDRILPMERVDRVDEQGRVHVKFASSEASNLPAYVRENYVTPPHGGVQPGLYPIPAYIPAYSTGINYNVEQKSAVTPDLLIVDRGTNVVDIEQRKLGEFDEVAYGDGDHVTGIVVRTGHLRHQKVEVSIDQLAGVGADYIRLSLTREDFDKLESEQAAS